MPPVTADTQPPARDTAVALLAAAARSYDAAIDSYRSGVATFIDVTNAQTALTKARTADTETRSSLFGLARVQHRRPRRGCGPDAASGADIPSRH